MKKFSLILLFVAIILIIPIYAYGDVGPKPSVVVNFEGFEGEMYYVTLLSEKPTTGPYSAVGLFEGSRRYSEEDVDYEIWQKFVSFQDRDGYYFCNTLMNALKLHSLFGDTTLLTSLKF